VQTLEAYGGSGYTAPFILKVYRKCGVLSVSLFLLPERALGTHQT